MRRGAAGTALLLILGACGSQPREPAEPIDSVQLNAIASSGPTVAEVLARGNDAASVKGAPPKEFDYKGVWATNPMLCKRNPWRFTATQADVGDESRCTIEDGEARTDSEIKLSVMCSAPGGAIRTKERWSLVHRADGTMIVARTAGNGVPVSATLARCG